MARAPTPRVQRPSKSWPTKWTALVLVLVASVMLLLQTEVSVFSTGVSDPDSSKGRKLDSNVSNLVSAGGEDSDASVENPESESKDDAADADAEKPPTSDEIGDDKDSSDSKGTESASTDSEGDKPSALQETVSEDNVEKDDGPEESDASDSVSKDVDEEGRQLEEDGSGKTDNSESSQDDDEDEGDRANGGKDVEGSQPEQKSDPVATTDHVEEGVVNFGGSGETGGQTAAEVENPRNEAADAAESNAEGEESKAKAKAEEGGEEESEAEKEKDGDVEAGEGKPAEGEGETAGKEEKGVSKEEIELNAAESKQEESETDKDPNSAGEKEAEKGEAAAETVGPDAGNSAAEKSQESTSDSSAERIDRSVRCFGRYIYMYDIPSKFNMDYVANCRHIHKTVNFCKAFNNSGMGREAQIRHSKSGPLELTPRGTWFETDQFSLEILFHARMKDYPCLTTDPEKATVFYVPFFAGLAIFRSLYEPDLEERDRDAHMVMELLGKTPWWDRFHGRDHLFVVTRVLLDFARGQVLFNWGNTLMSMSHMTNATVLAIEGHQNLHNSLSIPYPTSFHPRTDDDILQWQQFVRTYHRKYKIAFGGIGHGMGAQIRDYLRDLCVRSKPHCRLFHCAKRVCFRPHNVIWHYMNAHFCFQPPGDTPTRKGMFDCMLAGGIPVLFHKFTAFRYFWHLPPNHDSYSVYQSNDDFFKDNGTYIMDRILSFTPDEVERMRENVINLIPTLLYAMPGEQLHQFRDAFHIAVENTVQKVSKYLLPGHPRLPKSEWM